MKDMKLIMENWQKFTESEEVTEVIDPISAFTAATPIAISYFAAKILKPPSSIHQGVYIGPRISLMSFSLKELIAMAGLGALAKSGAGGKLKQLWSKLLSAEPETAEAAADSLDDLVGKEPKADPEAIEAFLASVAVDGDVEKTLANLLSIIDSGTASEEEMQIAIDAVNKTLADVASEMQPELKDIPSGLPASGRGE